MEIQEIISRGRFIFSGAPQRLEVYKLVNGRNSTKEISKSTKRSVISILNDLRKISDIGIIRPKRDKYSKMVKKDGSIVYEKVPLARQIPISYFQGVRKIRKPRKGIVSQRKKLRKPKPLSIPSEKEILTICDELENQHYEFKAPGISMRDLTKEVGAFLNTRTGGIIFYGIEDDGNVCGTDKRAQQLDQPLQNSIRTAISPTPPPIKLFEKNVLGKIVILIFIPPWNRRNVYQSYGKVRIRRGTNNLPAEPEELRKLHRGEYVV